MLYISYNTHTHIESLLAPLGLLYTYTHTRIGFSSSGIVNVKRGITNQEMKQKKPKKEKKTFCT